MRLTIDGQGFDLDAFTLSYLETALWSSTDNSRDDGGDPLDDNYDVIDFTADAIRQAIEDCDGFRAYVREVMGEDAADELDERDELAGHDFWLTRNRHGAGFWDGDWESGGDELTEAAHTFGSVDLYVHDGKVHSS